MPDASPSRVPARVLLYPLVGVLAVGNVVFALLWLLGPMGSGGRGERGGRRIAIRGADRALTVTEGAGGPTLGVGAPLAAEKFEMLVKRLARLAQSRRGGELARAYFESEAGRAAEPAVTIAFPGEGRGARLEAYAVDAHRQVCYCRAGPERTPMAVEADAYKALAAELAALGHGAAGGFALPFHVAVGDELKARLARLEGPLTVTTVAANPHDLLLDLANQPALAASLRLDRPDPGTLSASLALAPYGAMARGLADAMARASAKVRARHLDVEHDTETVRELARAIERPLGDLNDALVLQYGERVRVLAGEQLMARAEGGPLAVSAARFVGDVAVGRALDGLLAERGLLCFATGHGERGIDDTLRAGLSRPVGQLRARGFRVEPLDLAAVEAVPADCRGLILAGPRQPYGPAVEAKVERFVEAGGRLALLLDPPKGPPVLASLLARYGVAAAEPAKEFGAVQVELDRTLDFTRGWTREAVVLLTARALTVTPRAGAPWRVHCLARAFGDQPSSQSPCLIAAVRPAADGKGPKLLVAGDVDAFSNQSLVGLPGSLFRKPGKLFQLPGNIDLLVQALTWLAE